MKRIYCILAALCLLATLSACEPASVVDDSPPAFQPSTTMPAPSPSLSHEPEPEPLPAPLLAIDENAWWLNTDVNTQNAIPSIPVALEDIYGFSTINEWVEPQTLDGVYNPRGLCSFYPGMQAFIAGDESGTEGIYAGQGPQYVKRMYTPEPGIHLAGVSGSKYALYWAEYDDYGAWSVKLLRFEEGAMPEPLMSGEGAIVPPVFHYGYMLLTENVKGALTSRLLMLDMAHDHPIEHRPPVWMDIPERLAVYDFWGNGETASFTMLFESDRGPVARGFEPVVGRVLITGDAPVACNPTGETTAWLTETGNLYLHERLSKNTYLLAENVTWFLVADAGFIYADQGGARLCVAAMHYDEPGEFLDPYAPHEWQFGVLMPPEDGTKYTHASYEHRATLDLTLIIERNGVPQLKRLYIGTMNE